MLCLKLVQEGSDSAHWRDGVGVGGIAQLLGAGFLEMSRYILNWCIRVLDCELHLIVGGKQSFDAICRVCNVITIIMECRVGYLVF